jgi:hypothetical protein
MYGTHINVTVRNCRFEYGNNGPVNFPDSRPTGDDDGFSRSTFIVEDSEFIGCGNSGEGYAPSTHGIYLTNCDTLHLTGNRFYVADNRPPKFMDVPGGHMLKCGAYRSFIHGNLFDNSLGAYSSCIEFPYGGEHVVESNIFRSSDNMQGSGQGGAHVQAMNEWRAHGITRRKNSFLFRFNVHSHKGTMEMRDWYYRNKIFPDGDNTDKNIQQILFIENFKDGEAMKATAAQL